MIKAKSKVFSKPTDEIYKVITIYKEQVFCEHEKTKRLEVLPLNWFVQYINPKQKVLKCAGCEFSYRNRMVGQERRYCHKLPSSEIENGKPKCYKPRDM